MPIFVARETGTLIAESSGWALHYLFITQFFFS